MIPTQNPDILPRYNTYSPIYSEYSGEKSYVEEYIDSLYRKVSKLVPYANSNSKYFKCTNLTQWWIFLDSYMSSFNLNPTTSSVLKNRLLISIFDFSKYTEIRNIDLSYVCSTLPLLKKSTLAAAKISPKDLLAHIFKTVFTYSKSQRGFYYNLESDIDKNVKKCFQVSDEDLKKCDETIKKVDIIEKCENLEYYDYLRHLECFEGRYKPEMAPNTYSDPDSKTKDEMKPLFILPDFAAQDMAFLEKVPAFSKMLKKPCTKEEMFKFVDDIVNIRKMSPADKNNNRFLLLNNLVMLNSLIHIKSIEINNAQIFLKRFLELDPTLRNEKLFDMYFVVLSIALSKERNPRLRVFQKELAYIENINNFYFRPLRKLTDKILDLTLERSENSLGISYKDYIKHIKTSY